MVGHSIINLSATPMAELMLHQYLLHPADIPPLSARLKSIYNLILAHQPLWDIGCDHGYLGLHVYRNELCPEVHLVDRSREALQSPSLRIAGWFEEGSGEGIHVWCRDAEYEALPISIGTVVMAGIGTNTIVRIMVNLFSGLVPVGVRLVLASAFTGERLRLRMRRMEWRLQHEELYLENGNVRQILTCGVEGEIIQPFWNSSSLSLDNGLLETFLQERRQYFSVCQSSAADLLYLKHSFTDSFGI